MVPSTLTAPAEGLLQPQALPTAISLEAMAEHIGELAALTHAAAAELARAVAAFDTAGGWAGDGIRSCSHWLSINAGFEAASADELLRVGHALDDLPQIARGFAEGRLSLDKVRAVTRVATPADEELWLELAEQASASQLTRLCRGVRRALDADHPDRAERHLDRRGLWSYTDDDGMLRLWAVLPPEEGALLLAAIENVVTRHEQETGERRRGMTDVPDPTYDTFAARRADALASLCEAEAAGAGDDAATDVGARRLVVHVDAGVLTGAQPNGRCEIEDGPALSAAAARRIGCDATVIAITERDGLPIDVGRARRIVPTALRRAVHARDRTCRFPGCGVPSRRTHAHHIESWIDGGRTDLRNLVSLCGFHHRRLHDGLYRIHTADTGGLVTGSLRFITRAGSPIEPPSRAPVTDGVHRLREGVTARGARIGPETARAGEGGAPCDFDYAVGVIANACADTRARATDARAAPDP